MTIRKPTLSQRGIGEHERLLLKVSVPVMTWWGEQSEQERLPEVSTPALSIANTKGDLRVAPAPTYLQDDSVPNGPPPLMLMSGSLAS